MRTPCCHARAVPAGAGWSLCEQCGQQWQPWQLVEVPRSRGEENDDGEKTEAPAVDLPEVRHGGSGA